MPPPNVRVGVGVFILQSSKPTSNPLILIGKRLSFHGAGTFALPGGHLEFGESFEDCAAREVFEETGLQVSHVRFLTATNDYMKAEGRHYVTVMMVAARLDEMEEPRVEEPGKCEGWEWIGWEELRSWAGREIKGDGEGVERRLFGPLVNLVRQRPDVVPRILG